MTRHRTKRLVDVVVALPLALLLSPVMALLVVVATIDTRTWGVFRQTRIGLDGGKITVAKIRTMRTPRTDSTPNTITVRSDPRITRFGALIRRWKLDELPQLWSVVTGTMSLVGPRPDVPGYADELTGQDRIVLTMRPGVTGPASLVFRDEEELLADVADPTTYNDQVIWPAKVGINRAYARSSTLGDDLRMLRMTVRLDPADLTDMLARWDSDLLTDTATAHALDTLTTGSDA